MTRQQLTAPVKALLGQLTNNRPGQYFLESAVLVAQYLQGIGSGGNVYSSGEHVIFKTMKDKVGPNRSLCVFDVGANKGQFLSLACSCLDGRQFTIHSFEPGRNTYKQLCENAGKYTLRAMRRSPERILRLSLHRAQSGLARLSFSPRQKSDRAR